MVDNEDSNLQVDCADLDSYDPDLYEKLVRYAGDAVPLFDEALYLVVHSLDTPVPEDRAFQVRHAHGS